MSMRLKLALMACLFACTLPAQLVIGIHSGGTGFGGDLSYPGGGAPLTGTKIPLQLLTLLNTPSNAGSYTLTGPAAGAASLDLAVPSSNFDPPFATTSS